MWQAAPVPIRRLPALLLLRCLLALLILLAPASALADEPLVERFSFRRASDFFATGATLAEDSDGDGAVDVLLSSASVAVEPGDLAQGAFLQQALVYWGGTIAENANCAGGDSSVDSSVELTVPQGQPTQVAADACYCSGADNQSRDVQACRADVSGLVTQAGGQLVGPWTLGGFQARIDDGDTDNASWALVLIYGAPELPPRQLTVYDGLLTMRYDEVSFVLPDLEVDDPPSADLTWYVMEGDVGGSDDEAVSVRGLPGGVERTLSDDVNPAQGPMNRTINTTSPPQEGVVGVDIDGFDVSDALAAGDTSVEVTYAADADKWWLVFNIVGVRLFYSDFGDSSLTWVLSDDVDGDGPSPGDEVRYTVELVNTGEGNALVDLTAALPPATESWGVLDAAGGTDTSTAATLQVDGVAVDAGGSARVEFVLRIADVPPGTTLDVEAAYSVDGGGSGVLPAPTLTVGEDAGTDGPGDDDDGRRSAGGWSQGCGCVAGGTGAGPSGLVGLMALGLLGSARRRRG